MAEVILLCGRNGLTDTYTDADLKTVADRILPENAPREIEVVRNDGIATCTINAPDSLATCGTSVAVGQMIPQTDAWHEPGAPVPDGSYGIIRTDQEIVELVSDATASRTIYYRMFENLFVASTSQRAIMHFADDFIIDEAAIAWMVSSGTLGPSQAWDERLGSILPDSRVRLDRSTWELTERVNQVTIDPVNRSETAHRDRLVAALDDTFSTFDVNTSRWELTLSGGFDSRELLLRLQDQEGLQTITWGSEAALEDPESDAVRARELAEACGVSHRYYTLPETPENVGEVLNRFITAGEGRIDHVSGYLDGFKIFEDLQTRGVNGLIRGDEGFGWRPVGSRAAVLDVIGAKTIDDYETLRSLSIPGAGQQELPDRLDRRSGESLATWRDRLYLVYRIPVMLAALTAVKTPYTEVVNPFLTRRVLEAVRELPDHHRTDKQLYAQYVRERSPDVPLATRRANPHNERFLASEKSREYLNGELDTKHARSVLGSELVDRILNQLSEADETGESGSGMVTLDAIKRRIGSQLPQSLVRHIEAYTPVERPSRSITAGRLAFRAHIIQSMDKKLNADIDAL